MKNIKFIIILFIFSLNILFVSSVKADTSDLLISNIKQGHPKEGYIEVSWQTNQMANSYLIFGTSADNLPFYVGGSSAQRFHKADLTGLQKDKAYYFKIIAISENGGQAESFINYVDTKDLRYNTDSIELTTTQKQATNNAFALIFTSSRPIKFELKYGSDINQLDRSWKQGNLRSSHKVILKSLQADTKYYYRIIAKDEDGNVSEFTGNFKTVNHTNYDFLKISNLKPESKGQLPLMPEKAIITFESNVIATAEINFGLSPEKLNNRVNVTLEPGHTKHQAILEKLKPNTIYYYQIKLKSDLNKKSLNSQIYSLQTSPLSEDYLGLHYHDGDVVTYKGKTYLLFNDSKFPIYDNDTIKTLTPKPKTIASSHFTYYEEDGAYWGAFYDGQVVKEEKGNTVYLIDGQYKRPIANWSVFTYLNYQAKDIVIAKRGQLSKYKNGAIIKHSQELTGKEKVTINYNNKLIKSESSSAVYLLVNGKKMPFIDEKSFIANGYNFSQVKIISDNDIENLPLGMPIL